MVREEGLTVKAFLSAEVTVKLAPGDSWTEKLEVSTVIESILALPLTTKL